jgi:hypothetical protein
METEKASTWAKKNRDGDAGITFHSPIEFSLSGVQRASRTTIPKNEGAAIGACRARRTVVKT